MAHSEAGYEHVEGDVGPVRRDLMSINNPVPISGPYAARTITAAANQDALRSATHLRASLSQAERVLAITGLENVDGASVLAREVARALALVAQEPVALIASRGLEADSGTAGLADVLMGRAEIDAVLPEPDSGGLVSLPPGALPADASALFSSMECTRLFATLRARFRYVIVDAGPLRAPASLVLMTYCDAIAVALAAGVRRRADAQEAQLEVARLHKRLMGVILTRRM